MRNRYHLPHSKNFECTKVYVKIIKYYIMNQNPEKMRNIGIVIITILLVLSIAMISIIIILFYNNYKKNSVPVSRVTDDPVENSAPPMLKSILKATRISERNDADEDEATIYKFLFYVCIISCILLDVFSLIIIYKKDENNVSQTPKTITMICIGVVAFEIFLNSYSAIKGFDRNRYILSLLWSLTLFTISYFIYIFYILDISIQNLNTYQLIIFILTIIDDFLVIVLCIVKLFLFLQEKHITWNSNNKTILIQRTSEILRNIERKLFNQEEILSSVLRIKE